MPDIQSFLQRLPADGTFWIAYSGGADSTALLHMLTRQQGGLSPPLKAVHVDHRIHPDSHLWMEHCREQCRTLAVEIEVITIDASNPAGESPEAYARRLRYEAICRLLHDNDVLFTAHHMDDQAETMLLQLVRGAGPEGLASMPELRQMESGWLARPLLSFSREQLKQYNHDNSLSWIEDASNQQTGADRNFLRHVILPEMQSRWPAVTQTLSRSARNQAELMQVARETGETDFKKAIHADRRDILNIEGLLALSEPRQKNLLRCWIKSCQHPVPGSEVMQKILTEVIHARVDAMPCLQWSGTELRRYRNRLYLMHKLSSYDSSMTYSWNMQEALVLPHGSLHAGKCTGSGIGTRHIDDRGVTVVFRDGSDALQLPDNSGRKALKKLFQEADIPVWLRDRWPLLQINGELAAIAGYWTDPRYRAAAGEPGWKFTFHMFD